MQRCEVCGQGYHRLIRVEQDGREHLFDCFQCAISAMAPSCGHCGARIIGHGVGREGDIFCWQGCADAATRGQVRQEESVSDYA